MSTRRALALSIRAVHRPARQASALSPGRSASTVSAATEADPAPSPDPVPPIPVEPVLPDPQLDRLGYPRLPNISRQWRNPYAKWDDPQERVNLNETLHAEEDVMGMWAPDVYSITPATAARNLAIAAAVLAGVVGLVYLWHPSPPAVERRFPYDGLRKEWGGLAVNAEGDEQGGEDE